ncbi:MAG: NlpC/P60 family protein [Parolsenella sp.]|uniref:coiled-coil domain-containing protein n=1 Tax=unclassified Parolsenella TaxID=2623992 RepID=UPI002A761F74|nr:NlpC/P60 family protein [Parolsenella sp.]MCI5949610.1 NlpC/P60 family protein [Coriobacteriaceae bacterium]MDY3292165.1 NlpC/P60 family protein [Parolsenella sp.]
MNLKRTAPTVGKRLVVTVVTAGLLFATSPTAALAASSSDLQAQLQQAEAQTAKYQEQANNAFAELEQLQAELEDTRAQIASTQEEVSQKQTELDAAQDTLAGRVSSNYKTGGVSLVSILFDSSSFEDLVSRVYYANRVAESDAEVISQVQGVQAELAAKQNELESQQEEQQRLVDDAQSKAGEIQSALEQQQSYVNSLSSEVQEALAAEEAQRRAEAEAAANAGGNAGSSNSGSNNATSGNSGSSNNSGGNSGSNGNSSSGSHSNSGSHSSGNQDFGSGISGAIAAAKSQLGVSYSWAGNAIPGQEFDCSGLVWWAYKKAGISIPRGQRMSNGRGNSMIGWCLDGGGWTTDQSQLQAGDLMFWGSGVNSTTHVGMCIGGGLMIHSNWGGVEIASVYYSSGSFVGGGPIV